MGNTPLFTPIFKSLNVHNGERLTQSGLNDYLNYGFFLSSLFVISHLTLPIIYISLDQREWIILFLLFISFVLGEHGEVQSQNFTVRN